MGDPHHSGHHQQMYMDHEAATLPLNSGKMSAMRAEITKIDPEGGNDPEVGDKKKKKEKKPKKRGSGAGTAASVVLSFVYAKLVVVACIALLLTEVATFKIPLFFFEGFFSYLYGVGIIFFLYAFSCLLGGPGAAARGKRSRKVASGSKLTVNLFQPGQSGTYNVAEYSREAEEMKGRAQTEASITSPGQQATESLLGARDGGRGETVIADSSHGNIFLRVGVFLFGLGTLLYCAVELVGALLEIPRTSLCYDLIAGINPGLQAGFTFLQMIFILANTKLNISKFKVVARLGLMHLIAANICVWLRTIIREGVKDFTRYYVKTKGGPSEDQLILAGRGNMTNGTAGFGTTTQSPFSMISKQFEEPEDIANNATNATCGRISILGTIRDDSAPYLYPIVVQFSLVAAAIFFVMWRHVGHTPRYISEPATDDVEPEPAPVAAQPPPPAPSATGAPNPEDPNAEAEGEAEEEGEPGPRVCAGARKGLVFGILLVLCAIAAMVCYFVLLEMPEFKDCSIYLADSAHSGLLLVTLLAVFIGMCRVSKLRFDANKEDLLNLILLRLSAFGLILYAKLTIIAAAVQLFLQPAVFEIPTLLVFITAILAVFEVAFQAAFVLDANKRSIHKVELNDTKPGRQFVTFSLLTNLAMFGFYVFEAQKVDRLDVQIDFYGTLVWTVILKLTLPLAILHRFHAVTVLADVCRNAYKPKMLDSE